MHYYKRNIGDYAKKAGRLSMLEHGAYTLLLDACYDREEFPTREQAIEWAWASTPEEINAVDFVLSRFFIAEPDGTYTQARVLQELIEYAQFCELQADKGKKGGRPKKANGFLNKPDGLNKEPNGNPEESQCKAEKSLTTNHYPLTTNQEPVTKEKPSRKRSLSTVDEFIADCKVNGVKAIPDDDPVFDECEKSGIPTDYLVLNWRAFVRQYRDSGKRQKDWRATFRNSVRGRWYNLWWHDENGACQLTSNGRQIQKEFANHE